MKSAIRDPPNPNPMRIAEEVFWKSMMMIVAPSRPRPTVNIPATPPVRNATLSASAIEPLRAAAAVRTFPRTARLIPMKPVSPDMNAPAMNARVLKVPALAIDERPALPVRPRMSSGCSALVEVKKTTTATGIRITAIVRNCLLRYAIAPS